MSRLRNADQRGRRPSPCLWPISHLPPARRSCCSPADETRDTHSRLWPELSDSMSGTRILLSVCHLESLELHLSSSFSRLRVVSPPKRGRRPPRPFLWIIVNIDR